MLVVPPQEISPTASRSASTKTASPAAEKVRRRVTPKMKGNAAASTRPMLANGQGRVREIGAGGSCGQCCIADIEGLAETCTVSVELALEFAVMVTCAGLKLQFRPEASPLQARSTGPEKAPDLRLTAKVAELPTAIVALVGEIVPLRDKPLDAAPAVPWDMNTPWFDQNSNTWSSGSVVIPVPGAFGLPGTVTGTEKAVNCAFD